MEGFKRNQLYLSELVRSKQPKIIFLQEIWLPYSDQNLPTKYLPEYTFSIATPDMFEHPEDILAKHSHVWHGVAIGWKKDLNNNITCLETSHKRIAGAKLELQGGSLLLITLYAPTSGHDEDFLETISYLSDFIGRHSSPGDQILIGADSNCSSKSTTRRQMTWENFCEKFQLKTYKSTLPSFHHHNGLSDSFIDMFVASTTLEVGDVLQYCTLDTPHNLSSHDPIESAVSVQLSTNEKSSNYQHMYSTFNRQRIVWETSKMKDYQRLASMALSDALKYWNSPVYIPLLSSLVSKLLVSCANQVFTSSSSSCEKPVRKPPLEVRQARNILTRAFNAWKDAGKPVSIDNPARAAYKRARANLQRLVRHQATMKSIRQNNELMQLTARDRSKIFSLIKKARGEVSNSTTNILHTPVGTYYDEDILEGFAADAEHLGRPNEGASNCDQSFYKLCKLDNYYIFDFPADKHAKIPLMTITQLNRILSTKMKPGKACDVYQLTVEHLRHCGDQAKLHILAYINSILQNIYYLSCPQIKLGLGTAIHKGKKKSFSRSSSYRRITVTPIIGALIDYYLDPIAEAIFRPHQSPDQLGFTSGTSYLLAAIQRGECQRWAVDKKVTCFGVSLDGEAAFPSVERDIQVRELYAAGERGDVLNYSRNTYKNTECHMKMKNRLSRKFVEHKGNRQGHVRASGHFKVYVNSILLALNNSKLGFSLGPVCITAVCVADDAYLLAGSPSGLQGALDMISHYAKRYQLRFNADKTKIVVTGSKLDMSFYKDTSPWTLDGQTVKVVDSNEHLGLLVSGSDEEQLNVDEKIVKCRTSLFSLLGPAYSFKCLLSPTVQIHLWRTCNLPRLLSGLTALPIRPAQAKALETFHKKVLRGFLKLSRASPIPALYFLLGELPVEATLHIRTLGLFHNIMSNPNSTVYPMVKYIMQMCSRNSTTWSNHVQLLCLKYGLPPPLSLLKENLPAISKDNWSILVKTRVTIWHEREIRKLAENNSKMKYLNVQLSGLNGNPHPALNNILNTRDVKKLRTHLKFLTCDVLCNELLACNQPSRSPACDLCGCPIDSIEHILVSCRALSEVRDRLYPELVNTVVQVQPNNDIIHTAHHSPNVLAQFILDCTSTNLPESYRIPAHNPEISAVFRISRDWCFAIHSERSRQLKTLTRL